ncbi:MAG: gamma-glutamyltransferase [Actinobacteria bacterium]|nr:gamma-glutamyltransferase [Actinomycetota bacterium]
MTTIGVAAASQIAADAGTAMADGGNAVDAALAAAVTSLCTEPGIMCAGGSGFVTIWPPDDDPIVIDGYAEIPRGDGRTRLGDGIEAVEFDYGGIVAQGVGYGAVATPGAFAALGAASRRYGRLPWHRVLEPVIAWADAGFPVSRGAAVFLQSTFPAIYGWQRESARLLADAAGRALREGDILYVPGLGDTLRTIATHGAGACYDGPVGATIGDYVHGHGGLLTAGDLAAYEPVVRDALTVDIHDWTVATNPSPAIGGVCMAAMLLLSQARTGDVWDAGAAHALARVQDAVLSFRASCLDGVGVGPEAADAVAALLSHAREGDVAALLGAPSTVHTSAVDADGWACSITASGGYGSGVLVPDVGMWLNNSLGEFDLHPEGIAQLPPGSRLASNMAPTVARGPDGAVLAIGSPGAGRITTAVAQVLYHHLDLGADLDTAVQRHRLHVETVRGRRTISCEPDVPIGSPDGYDVRIFDESHMFFGGVAAARWSPSAGVDVASDHRRGGAVAVATSGQ